MDDELKVQVLAAAMHQTDFSLLEKMNIQTSALVGNQCDRCSNESIEYKGNECTYFNRPYRGVGLNRNEALFHAHGGIVSFADEDMTYVDGYEKIIQKAYKEIPKADAILFNVRQVGTNRLARPITKIHRLRFYNSLHWATPNVTALAKKLKRENISFHLSFGGGALYSCGEDSVLLMDMLRHGLKLYAHPAVIATVDQSSSTWFKGYNKKLLFDNGALFAALSKRWCKLLCIQSLIRHPNTYKDQGLKFSEAYRIMKAGIDAFGELKGYNESI